MNKKISFKLTTQRNITTGFPRDCVFVKQINADVGNSTLTCTLQIDEETEIKF